MRLTVLSRKLLRHIVVHLGRRWPMMGTKLQDVPSCFWEKMVRIPIYDVHLKKNPDDSWEPPNQELIVLRNFYQ